MDRQKRSSGSPPMIERCLLCAALILAICGSAWAKSSPTGPRFEISFPESVHRQPITGRLLLMISRENEPEVRLQDNPAMFGADLSQLKPGQTVAVDKDVSGYPVRSLRDIPSGDYYVQALLNVYTEFHRADGHVIWAHMDQWEGQRFESSPGNLYSKVLKLHLDPSRGHRINLQLTEVFPPVQVPADTEWVKHIKIQSKLLTQFWGHPIYLGAVVLLPRDYASRSDLKYPVIFQQGHFSLDGPFNFRTDVVPENEEERRRRENRGTETGYQFYEAWRSDHFPRMVAVTFQHPTPYYDDSYAVNSVNNGPYGDAIMTELIPYVEEHFRIIRQPYARVLTGGSTGGWESLALQVYHSDFFGGTWTLYPDPVDFRRYGLVDIYADDNSFVLNSADSARVSQWVRSRWSPVERPFMRSDDGQPVLSMRELSQLEAVQGSKGRSGGVLENWEATYGPVGDDGYPKPLWDKLTGEIDHSVAEYMRDHGYDLRYYAETNWARIGPQIVGKLHLYCGDMDNFYLNLGVYFFQQFLQESKAPHYLGTFEYGRPMKGHGWQPVTNAALVRMMAEEIARNAPKSANRAWLDGGE